MVTSMMWYQYTAPFSGNSDSGVVSFSSKYQRFYVGYVSSVKPSRSADGVTEKVLLLTFAIELLPVIPIIELLQAGEGRSIN